MVAKAHMQEGEHGLGKTTNKWKWWQSVVQNGGNTSTEARRGAGPRKNGDRSTAQSGMA